MLLMWDLLLASQVMLALKCFYFIVLYRNDRRRKRISIIIISGINCMQKQPPPPTMLATSIPFFAGPCLRLWLIYYQPINLSIINLCDSLRYFFLFYVKGGRGGGYDIRCHFEVLETLLSWFDEIRHIYMCSTDSRHL